MITYTVLRRIGESLEPTTVAQTAVEAVAELTKWPTVSVLVPDGTDRLVVRALVGPTPVYEGISNRAFRTGHTQIVPASVHEPGNGGKAQAYYCAVSIPMLRGSRRLGVFNVESKKPTAFGPNDILLAESLAEVIALAMDNAQLFAESQERLRAQTALQEAGAVIASTLDLPTVLNRIAEQMCRAIDATSVYICSYDPESVTATVLAEYFGARATRQERSSDLGVTYHLSDLYPNNVAFLERGLPSVEHVGLNEGEIDVDQPHEEAGGARSTLTIPLQVGGRTVAYTELWESWQRREFNEKEIELCQGIAQQAAVAIENARLFSETERRLQEQTTLREAAEIISSSLDLSTVLYRIAEQTCQALSATSAYICTYEPEEKTSTVIAEYISIYANSKEKAQDIGTTYYLPTDFPDAVALLDAGEIYATHVDDPNIPEPEREHLIRYGAYSVLTIPLRVSGRTIAFAELWESRQKREFTVEEITLCKGVAQQAAVAIDNAQLFQTVKEQHSRLQTVIESTNEGIVLIDSEGRLLFVNSVTLRLFYFEGDPESWNGRFFSEALLALRGLAPNAVSIALAESRRLESGDTKASEGELELPPRSIHWGSIPVKIGPSSIGRLLVLRDITEQKLLKQMRDDMTHTMVHDLRGPLTAISTSLDILSGYRPGKHFGEKREMALARAREGTQRILALVNDILDVNKLEGGEVRLEFEPVSIAYVVHKILDLQLPVARMKSVQLENSVSIMTPLVWGDKRLLERALQNLVDNALKFTPGGGSVQIAAEPDTSDPSKLLISVSDTGSGIAPSVQERLFQKFATGADGGNGSGLGLYLCKMVIEAHGGRIWVGSSSRNGTTLNLTLPIFASSRVI